MQLQFFQKKIRIILVMQLHLSFSGFFFLQKFSVERKPCLEQHAFLADLFIGFHMFKIPWFFDHQKGAKTKERGPVPVDRYTSHDTFSPEKRTCFMMCDTTQMAQVSARAHHSILMVIHVVRLICSIVIHVVRLICSLCSSPCSFPCVSPIPCSSPSTSIWTLT